MLWELKRRWYNWNNRYTVMGRRPGESREEYRQRLRMQIPYNGPSGIGKALWRLVLWGALGIILWYILGLLVATLLFAGAVAVLERLMDYGGPRRRRRGF